MTTPHRTRALAGRLFIDTHTPQSEHEEVMMSQERGPEAQLQGPSVEASLTHERGLGRAQHIVGS